MNETNPILQNLLSKKGQFTRASWGRTCKVRKGSPDIRKVTVTTVRAGLDYSSLTAVEALRASGDLPSEPQPLPWGEWINFPYTISHKDEIYIRLYPSENANTQVSYFMNDKEVSYEDVEEFLLASEKRKENSESPLCITVKLKDMIELY